LNRVKKRRLPSARFDQTISQLKGQLMIATESTPNRMHRLARQELMLGRYVSLEETLKQINAVTPSDVLRVANRLFDRSQMTVTALGPVDEKSLTKIVGGRGRSNGR
jgi:predicted Zn-dependent peptidase